MQTITKILIPTDFSEFSNVALDYVLSTEPLSEAKIFFLYVVDVESVHGSSRGESNLNDIVDKAVYDLDRFVFRKTRGKNVSPVIRQGEACKQIIDYANKESVDLIVMATHGRTGLAHVLMGSVTEKVIRYSSVPVLTIKPEAIRENLLQQNDIDEQLHLSMNF